MPIILEPKSDPLYQKGWSEAWSEARFETKLNDALIMIKKFNLDIDVVAKELGIDKKF